MKIENLSNVIELIEQIRNIREKIARAEYIKDSGVVIISSQEKSNKDVISLPLDIGITNTIMDIIIVLLKNKLFEKEEEFENL